MKVSEYSEKLKSVLNKNKKIYYQPVRVGNFYSNNYIKYESNGDRNQNLINQRIPQ